MVILLLVLLVGVLAYFVWRRMATTLTRTCRWRKVGDHAYRCTYCGARARQTDPPLFCARR